MATARRSGLGKGLASLIPPGGHDTDGIDDALREVSVTSIVPNPGQPRAQFDEESLSELTTSIRALGVLQPVLVREVDTDQYQLIAGERRWRAARRAGLTTIPAIIRRADDRGVAEQALVENLQRQDLTALEEAAAYQQLIEDFGLTHDEVATRVGKSRSTVTNTVRLLQLPPAVQRMVAEGRLTAGHARALLGTPDRAFQEQLARRAVEEHWTVRETEDAVREPPGEEVGDEAGPRTPVACPGCRPCGHLASWNSRGSLPSTSTRGSASRCAGRGERLQLSSPRSKILSGSIV